MKKTLKSILFVTFASVILVLALVLACNFTNISKDDGIMDETLAVSKPFNAPLDYNNNNYPRVEVNSDETLRDALYSEDSKFIVVTKDITVESKLPKESVENRQYYSSIPSIIVRGNKILHLNGHEIYYQDSSHIYNYHYHDGFGVEKVETGKYDFDKETYKKTLMTLNAGAKLTIMDNEDNTGTLQFDSLFGNSHDLNYDTVRNVIEVVESSELVIHGGNIIAGRNKVVYGYIHDDAAHMCRTRNFTLYNMGAAVVQRGGRVCITGGILKGRGYTYNNSIPHGAIQYSYGSLEVEGGKIFGYGRASAIHVYGSWDFYKDQILIRGGYFESYCETYASFTKNGDHEMKQPTYQTFSDTSGKIDPYEGNLTNKDKYSIAQSFDHSGDGDDAGDWGKSTCTITPKNRTLDNVLQSESGSAESATIYQYQPLNVKLNYWDDAVYRYNAQFYNTELMKSYLGADTYNPADYGISAFFVLFKKVSTSYVPISKVTIVRGMNAEFPLNMCVKAGDEKWEAGEYQLICNITEKSGDKEFKNTTNVLNINVVDGAEMLEFEDVIPKQFTNNLGIINLGTKVELNYNAKSKIELDSHLSLQKVYMVKGPNDSKYYQANADPILGKLTIDASDPGYYSINELIQLKKGNEILKQKSRECHFTAKNLTIPVTVISYNTCQYRQDNQVIGKTRLTDNHNNAHTSFAPGDKVFVDVTPQMYGKVKQIVVEKNGGGTVDLVSEHYFTMPDEEVTVKVYYGEKPFTLTYRESDNSNPIVVHYDYEEGVELASDICFKQGYRLTGWKIGNNTYNLGETYRERANTTAYPIYESIKYTKVSYVFNQGFEVYTDNINYDYAENPYYTILWDANFPSEYLDGKHVDYYELYFASHSEIEGKDYAAGTKFYPGDNIYPLGENMALVAHLVEQTELKNVLFYIPILPSPPQNVLDIGTNNFGLSVKNCRVLTDPDPSLNQVLDEMILPAHTPTTITVYIYPDDGYYISSEYEIQWGLYKFQYRANNTFVREPLIERKGYGLNGTSITLDITFYPSCGNNDEDHTWSAEPTDTPHWCTGSWYNEYTCTQDGCGIKKYEKVEEMPDNLTIEQLHRLQFVDEVVGDCSHGEYSVNSHYVCKDCGAWFKKVGVGAGSYYVETCIDDETYLHSWSDLVPETVVVYGQEMHVHSNVCMVCGLRDESSRAIHHNDEHGYGQCDECTYVIPCNHDFIYTEDLSTCNHQGRMTITCEHCEYEETIIYNYGDHTLVYVSAVPSTCCEQGMAEYYICSHCGKIFDVDINEYINTLDPNNLRAIPDLDADGCEYQLTTTLEDLLDAEYALDSNYKYEDAINPGLYHWDWDYIKAHSAAYGTNNDLKKVVDAHYIVSTVNAYRLNHEVNNLNTLKLPLDPDNHIETHIEGEIAVSVSENGYTGDVYCSGCGKKLETGEVIVKHDHSYTGNEWEADENNHWHVCNAYDGCTEKLDTAAHTYGDWTYKIFPDKIGKKVRECTVCGHPDVQDWEVEPTVINGVNTYTITDGLFGDENGQDVSYIFNLAKEHDGVVIFNINELQITFDQASVQAIGGKTVSLKVTTSTEGLETFGIEGAQMVIDITLTGAAFENGKATVSSALNDVPENNLVKVFYVNGENKEDMNATYQDYRVTFETNHFSKYVIAYNAIKKDDEGGNGNNGNNNAVEPKKGLSAGAIAGIVIAIVVALGATAFCLYWFIFRKKKDGSGPQNPETPTEEPVKEEINNESETQESTEPAQEGVVFGEKKSLNEEYDSLTDEQKGFFDSIKAHASSLEGVKCSEAQDYCTVSFKKEKIVRFKIKKGEVVAEFFANDKELKELAGGKIKESSANSIKVQSEEDVNKAIEIIDYKYKNLTEE